MNQCRYAVATATLAAGVLLSLSTAGGAAATTLSPGNPAPAQLVVIGGGSSNAAVTPLTVDRLAPGSTVIQRFRLHLVDDASGVPAAGFRSISDRERGCIHPEVAAGDTSCGSGDDQGELSTELLAGVTWEPAPAAGCDHTAPNVPITSLRSLQDQVLAADGVVSSEGPDTCLTVTLTLPTTADNLVQSDATSFDLEVGINDTASHAGFSGGGGVMVPNRQQQQALAGGMLPLTGLPMLSYVLLAVGLIQLGLLARRAGNRVP